MKWFIKYKILLKKYNELKLLIDRDFWGDLYE